MAVSQFASSSRGVFLRFHTGAVPSRKWALTGLPELWSPVFEVEGFERASIDRFWVGVDARDPRFDRAAVESALAELGASRIGWAGARRAR